MRSRSRAVENVSLIPLVRPSTSKAPVRRAIFPLIPHPLLKGLARVFSHFTGTTHMAKQ